jgi:hypothetical protein
MLVPLCFSVFFPFDSDVFRSCTFNGSGLVAHGAKDGLISFMGKCVFGCASPLATCFATAGVISLVTFKVSKSDILGKHLLSDKRLVGWAQ